MGRALILLPEPGADRGHRHVPVARGRIIHNIDTVAADLM
jgi:hypothetical protein